MRCSTIQTPCLLRRLKTTAKSHWWSSFQHCSCLIYCWNNEESIWWLDICHLFMQVRAFFSIVWNAMSLLVNIFFILKLKILYTHGRTCSVRKMINSLAPFPWNIQNLLFLWLSIIHNDNGTLTPPTYPNDFNPTTPRTPGVVVEGLCLTLCRQILHLPAFCHINHTIWWHVFSNPSLNTSWCAQSTTDEIYFKIRSFITTQTNFNK